MESHLVYNGSKAVDYDDNAAFEKGNRELHKTVLTDILSFLEYQPQSFIDIGCGTGYFMDVFFELNPEMVGVAIDGSEDMLARAQQKFQHSSHSINFIQSKFQEIDFSGLPGSVDLIFSCLALHHLTEQEKNDIYIKIYNQLSQRGVFILFDLFKKDDSFEDKLLEHIACRDIQRKLKQYLEIEDMDGLEIEELKIKNIIENDRREKAREGDQESSLSVMTESLNRAGFSKIIPVYQENRFVSLVIIK